MSKDMKCPICGTILDKAFINDKIRGCPKCRNMGNIELWQELIRTRKALDVLLFTINRLENQNYKDCAWHLRLAIAKIEASGIANKALE